MLSASTHTEHEKPAIARGENAVEAGGNESDFFDYSSGLVPFIVCYPSC